MNEKVGRAICAALFSCGLTVLLGALIWLIYFVNEYNNIGSRWSDSAVGLRGNIADLLFFVIPPALIVTLFGGIKTGGPLRAAGLFPKSSIFSAGVSLLAGWIGVYDLFLDVIGPSHMLAGLAEAFRGLEADIAFLAAFIAEIIVWSVTVHCSKK